MTSPNNTKEYKNFKTVIAWQKSYALAKMIYQLTERFPSAERFGIVSQMRRAAISIPSNIAEGYHRSSRKEYRHFCFIAYSSANELQTQLLLSKDLSLAPTDAFRQVDGLIDETLRLLNRLCCSL